MFFSLPLAMLQILHNQSDHLRQYQLPSDNGFMFTQKGKTLNQNLTSIISSTKNKSLMLNLVKCFGLSFKI
jgi:hypothetical protein